MQNLHVLNFILNSYVCLYLNIYNIPEKAQWNVQENIYLVLCSEICQSLQHYSQRQNGRNNKWEVIRPSE